MRPLTPISTRQAAALIWRLVPLMIFQSLLTAFAHAGGTTLVRDNLAVQLSVKSWTEYRDENLVKQKRDYSCGAASLATVMRMFFLDEVTEKEIVDFLLKQPALQKRKKEQQEDFALSFQDLKEYAHSRGYRAIALALPIKTLRELRVPAILYVEMRDYEHFTVFKGIKDGFVYFADPSFGNMKVRIARFKESFYTRSDLRYPGKALVLIPKDKQRQERINISFMEVPERSGFVYEVLQNKAISVDSAIP